jgi:hypothetical protein
MLVVTVLTPYETAAVAVIADDATPLAYSELNNIENAVLSTILIYSHKMLSCTASRQQCGRVYYWLHYHVAISCGRSTVDSVLAVWYLKNDSTDQALYLIARDS